MPLSQKSGFKTILVSFWRPNREEREKREKKKEIKPSNTKVWKLN